MPACENIQRHTVPLITVKRSLRVGIADGYSHYDNLGFGNLKQLSQYIGPVHHSSHQASTQPIGKGSQADGLGH